MIHETDSLRVADGRQLFTQRWLPGGAVKAHLLIVHGYAEYSARYEHLADFLTTHRYAVHSFDLRGHGRSEGLKAYVDRFELYLKDLTAVLDAVKVSAKKQPIFLFGHSMGGAIVTLYVISRQPRLRGVILSGAALQVSKEISPLLQRFSSVIGSWAPKLKTITLDSKAVSRDPAVVKAYEQDPLIYHDGTYARTGAELIRATKQIQANMEKFKLPVLLLHGTADRLTEPDGSRDLEQRAASTDKTLHLYDGLYHELINEPEKEQVMQDILEWLEARCDS